MPIEREDETPDDIFAGLDCSADYTPPDGPTNGGQCGRRIVSREQLGRLAARAPQESGQPRLADIVRQHVGPSWRLTHVNDRGRMWSETRGRWVSRAEFIRHVTESLLQKARAAVDAPTYRLRLLRAVRSELEIVWSNLVMELPCTPGRRAAGGLRPRKESENPGW